MLYCLEKAARGKTNDFLVDKWQRDVLQRLATLRRCNVLYSLSIRCLEIHSDLFELRTRVPLDVQMFTISESDHVEAHMSSDQFYSAL